MKQDSYAVIGKAPKATGICLDELDGTVKAFSASVADVVHAVIEQPLRMRKGCSITACTTSATLALKALTVPSSSSRQMPVALGALPITA